MGVNKYKLRINQARDGNPDQYLTLPIDNTTDEVGRGDLVKEYEDETIAKLLHLKKDYEVTRFSHAPHTQLALLDPQPDLHYDFAFGYPAILTSGNFTVNYTTTPFSTTIINNPLLDPALADSFNTPCPEQIEQLYPPPPDGRTMFIPPIPSDPTTQYGYELQGFSVNDTYKNVKSFVKSFYKLDLYDSPIRNEQQLYISIIINPINGELLFRPTIPFGCNTDGIPNPASGRWNCRPEGEQSTPIPKIKLDALDNNEGYFIYWLKENTFLDIDTFYMTAKFYNGKSGEVISFLNTDQNLIPNPYSFKTEDYFYYKVKLNRNDYTYKVENLSTGRVGLTNTPIRFWQYFNAQ